MKKRLLLLSGLVSVSIGLTGCSDSGSTSAPTPQQEQQNVSGEPTTTAAPSPAQPTPEDVKNHLKPGPEKLTQAGGLGDSYSTIIETYGQPSFVTQPFEEGTANIEVENGTEKISMMFVQSRVMHMQIDGQDLSVEEALELAKKFMPSDAKFIKKYHKDVFQYHVYESKSLNKLFDPKWFENAEGKVQPGYFDVSLLMDEGRVKSFSLFVSDNP